MNKNIYRGPFKDYLQSYIELKRAVGYKFDTEESNLERFDRFMFS